MSIARNISGNKPPARAHSQKTRLDYQDRGLAEAKDTSKYRKSINKRKAAEAEFNKDRPVAALQGYFRVRGSKPCKHFTPEEIAAMNQASGSADEEEPLTTDALFSYDEIWHQKRLCLKRKAWLRRDNVEIQICDMDDDYLVNTIMFIKRKSKRKDHRLFFNSALRLFAAEVAKRGLTTE